MHKASVEAGAVEWVYLFDGTSTQGWRGYGMDSLPPGWTIKDSSLTFDTVLGLEQDYEGGKDIIYGAEEFDNFELYLEWKLPEGGNSGIFYHVKEGYEGPPVVAPEYQLIDDENYAKIHDLTAYNSQFGAEHPELLQDWQKTGADYAMHTADQSQKELNPVGAWNSSKIIFTPKKVEHWLNEKKYWSLYPGQRIGMPRKIQASGTMPLITGNSNQAILHYKIMPAPSGFEILKSKNYE